MPGVKEDSEAYLADRRREVGAAVEASLVDGAVTERERAILPRLETSPGIAPTEAVGIETAAGELAVG